MNIFTVFAWIICSFNLIYTLHVVNLGVLHHDEADAMNVNIMERRNRFYQRQGKSPRVKFLQTSVSDILSANNTLCELAAVGIIGLIAPSHPLLAPILESICIKLEIPYIEYMHRIDSKPQEMTINFFPEDNLLAEGYAAIVKHMQWNSFTVLYESLEGLVKLRDVLQLNTTKDNPLIFRQIHPDDDYRAIFKEVKNHTENTIIIDCSVECTLNMLMQAKEVGILELNTKFFLSNLDAHTINFTSLNTTSNITTVSLLNTSNPSLHHHVKDWNDEQEYQILPEQVKVEQAILHDATTFFLERFYELRNVDKTSGYEREPLSCDEDNKLSIGYRMFSYMVSKAEEPGGRALTAPIQFNRYGERINFTLYGIEIVRSEKEIISRWDPSMKDDVEIYRNYSQQLAAAVENLRHVLVLVGSKEGTPYLMRKPGTNDSYEGYAYDLIQEIATHLNFTFKFEIYKETGKYDENKKRWDGLIGDLVARKIHLGICDLTITEARRSAVDFSLPFMNLGISILHRKPDIKDDDNKFAFMDPFDVEVWIFTVTLYLITSSVLYVICRFAPGDWENPHPCDPNPEELENIWDLKNCFWLTLGSIMTQGCDILPKGISSRMGASMWWFFSLIMTSSYTANLAAFLTKERMGSTIENAEDLVKQTKIKYGTVLDGATMAFFKNSNFSTYARLWTNMDQSKDSVFEKSNADGVKRVLTTKHQRFAFFMESSSIEYEIEKNCNLKSVGGRLDSKGYGIAMPMNAGYRRAIDQQILLCQESGKLAKFKNTWWKERVEKDPSCTDRPETEDDTSSELSLDHVGGVFIVLSTGVALAFVLALVEFLWNVHQVAVEEHMTYGEALMVELKFAFKVWITKKKAKPVLSASSSSNQSDTRSIAQKMMTSAGSFINLDVFERLSTGRNN